MSALGRRPRVLRLRARAHRLPPARRSTTPAAVVGASLRSSSTGSSSCLARRLPFARQPPCSIGQSPHRIKGRYEAEFLLAARHAARLPGTSSGTSSRPWIRTSVRPAGDVNAVEPTNPAKLHFDKLHARSEKVAGTVLFLGLGVLFLISREHTHLSPEATEPASR